MNDCRHNVWFQEPVENASPDARADERVTYQNWKQAWVSLEPLQGRELQWAQQQHGQVTHKVKMRYLRGLTQRHRFVWDGRTFNIGPPLATAERQFEHGFYANEGT